MYNSTNDTKKWRHQKKKKKSLQIKATISPAHLQDPFTIYSATTLMATLALGTWSSSLLHGPPSVFALVSWGDWGKATPCQEISFLLSLFFTSRSSPQTHFFHLSRVKPRGGGTHHAMPQVTHTPPHTARRQAKAPSSPGQSPSGWTPGGCPAAEGPQAPPHAAGSCPAEQQCRAAGRPDPSTAAAVPAPSGLSPSIISCGPSPLPAAILFLLSPPPSGNRLNRRCSQS